MERNRIQKFLVEVPELNRDGRLVSDGSGTTEAPSSFVMIPPALWADLDGTERSQFAAMYQQAFLQADAQIRRECVERLLESITAP